MTGFKDICLGGYWCCHQLDTESKGYGKCEFMGDPQDPPLGEVRRLCTLSEQDYQNRGSASGRPGDIWHRGREQEPSQGAEISSARNVGINVHEDYSHQGQNNHILIIAPDVWVASFFK